MCVVIEIWTRISGFHNYVDRNHNINAIEEKLDILYLSFLQFVQTLKLALILDQYSELPSPRCGQTLFNPVI